MFATVPTADGNSTFRATSFTLNCGVSRVLWNFIKNTCLCWPSSALRVWSRSNCMSTVKFRFCFNAVFCLMKWTVPGNADGHFEICWNISLKKNFLKSISSAYCWNNFYINNLIKIHGINKNVKFLSARTVTDSI